MNSEIKSSYLAHVKQDKTGNWSVHELEEHLRCVGELAAKMVNDFGSEEWAKVAGLWHDLRMDCCRHNAL